MAYDPVEFVIRVIDPALTDLEEISKRTMLSAEARQMMLTIAIQESDLCYRCQSPSGPARGFWQFEGDTNQALDLIIKHDTVGPWLAAYTAQNILVCDLESLYTAIEYHDQVAAVLARLLLFTDYRTMPTDQDIGWDIYLACWQPGKPRPEHWPESWARAEDALTGFVGV